MCRFALYLGPDTTLDALVTLPANSIIHQSYHSHLRREPLNGDGFGLAWYAPGIGPEPALFRSITPAWNNRNLRHLARVTRSGCVLAHVRAASPGLPVTETNCHPFVHGRLAFMHNGQIGDFERLRRPLRRALSDRAYDAIEGSTDSEVLFAMLLDAYDELKHRPPLEALHGAVELALVRLLKTAQSMGASEPSVLNLAVTDGTCAVATRYSTHPDQTASLYAHWGRRYVCEAGVCRMLDPEGSRGAVLVCSEPLSDDPGWQRVEDGYAVLVDENHSVSLTPLAVARLPPAAASA